MWQDIIEIICQLNKDYAFKRLGNNWQNTNGWYFSLIILSSFLTIGNTSAIFKSLGTLQEVMLWFTICNNVFFNTGGPIFTNVGGCPSKSHALLIFKLVSFLNKTSLFTAWHSTDPLSMLLALYNMHSTLYSHIYHKARHLWYLSQSCVCVLWESKIKHSPYIIVEGVTSHYWRSSWLLSESTRFSLMASILGWLSYIFTISNICHVHKKNCNWYISVICLYICQKSQSSFLVYAKSSSLNYCVSDLSMYPMFQQILYTSTIPPLNFALWNVCINNLS